MLIWNHCIIHYWKGTDSLKLDTFPPTSHPFRWYTRILLERLWCHILEPFTAEHWIVHERLRKHLLNFGIKNVKIKVVIDPPLWPEPVEKIEHGFFNILYYCPVGKDETFLEWKYGFDIYKKLVSWFKDSGVCFYWLPKIDEDMKTIYATTDCYIRPSRHDGEPRMVLECKINNIPYLYSEDGNPKLEDFIEFIQEQYDKFHKTTPTI